MEEITLEGFCEVHQLDINDDSIKCFYNRRSYIRIDENLQSHTAHKLIKVLKKKFKINHIYSENPDTRSIIEIEVDENNEYVNDESLKTFDLMDSDNGIEFKKYLDFYNYYLTYVEKIDNGYKLYLEPLYTDPITHPKICYHICEKDALNSILKTGLRPKIGKSKLLRYRYFPERVFMIVHSDKYKEDIKDVISDLQLKNYVILKIDTSKCNITFFQDLASENPHCIYTYESIPPKLIEVFELDQ